MLHSANRHEIFREQPEIGRGAFDPGGIVCEIRTALHGGAVTGFAGFPCLTAALISAAPLAVGKSLTDSLFDPIRSLVAPASQPTRSRRRPHRRLRSDFRQRAPPKHWY
jgi:hypothetical protein